MSHATVNTAYPLRLLLGDGLTGLYPQAKVYSAAGALVATVALVHIAEGLYGANWTPSVIGYYAGVFTVYTDSGHTTPSTDYEKSGDEIEVTATMTDDVLEALLVDHMDSGSVGEAITLMLGLLHHNFLLDNPTYNDDGLLTAARIRIFPTAADTTAGTNALATYAVVGTADPDDESRPLTYKRTRTS